MSDDPRILAALLRIEQLLAALLELQAADYQDDGADDAPQYLNVAPRK